MANHDLGDRDPSTSTNLRRRAEELFQNTVELPAEKQAVFLDGACGSDAALRRAVSDLLRAHERGVGDFLGSPAIARAALAGVAAPDDLPARIGPYAIVRKIGEGGMGIVFEARQLNPERSVALKIIRPGFMSRELLRRFQNEAQVLGWLQHPGIAQIYEAGTAELVSGQWSLVSGQSGAGGAHSVTDHCPLPTIVPFFAMELVEGRTLTNYTVAHALSLRRRLELFASVCDAVAHAHERGVIHRDLKPANILVTEGLQISDCRLQIEGAATVRHKSAIGITPQADPPRRNLQHAIPKILDFGVARATHSDVQATTLQTDVGQLIGTLAYMSPEQVSGDPRQVDAGSDVYALGVILYELLTGRLPYDVRGRPLPEVIRLIRETEPTRLSLTGSRGARASELRGDLETITFKALEKDRTRRYATATALADDVRRYLRDEPIAARPASLIYTLGKLTRRHKGLVGGVAAAFVFLIIGTVFATVYAFRADHQRHQAETERDRARKAEHVAAQRQAEAEAVTVFLTQALESADPSLTPGHEMTVREMLERAVAGVEGELADQPRVAARVRLAIGGVYRTLGLYPAAVAQLRSALVLQREAEPHDNEQTARILDALGTALTRQGELVEAESLYREALELRRRLLGPRHVVVAESLANLGVVLGEQRKYDEAAALHREVLAIFQETYGELHRHVAGTAGNLAAALFDGGDRAGAMPYYEQALSIWRRILGPNDPDLARSLNNYGFALREQGQLDAAEPLLRESIAIYRNLYVGAHDDLAMALHNLAVLLFYGRGDLEAADPLMREAEALHRKLLPPDHPSLIKLLHDKGTLLFFKGDHAGAEATLRETVSLSRRVMPRDQHFAMTLNNLAAVLKERGANAEAEPLFGESLDLWRETLGERHAHVAMALHQLGELHEARGDLAGAEDFYRQALELRRELFGATHPLTIRSLARLGGCLTKAGRYASAETELLEAYRALAAAGDAGKTQEQEQEQVLVLVEGLSELYTAWGRPEDAAHYKRPE